MALPALYLMLGFVAGQRLAELWLANRNTRRLKAAGAVEIGARHYPLFVMLHASWLVALALFVPSDAQPNLWLIALFLLLQLGRLWVIASLGPYWTTRILHVPGAPLVKKGPFRFVRHPNYVIVAGEIAVLPLAFGAWKIAVLFSLLSAILTLHRIRVEQTGLAARPGWKEL
jgi:methyltransferase